MGALFGKTKRQPTRVTEQDRAVLHLKRQRDELKRYQKRIESSLESDRRIARTLLADGKRDRAKLMLRKKRYQERLLANTDDRLDKLERLVHDIEFAQVETKVLDGLKLGNEALKKVHEALNVDEIERILEETKEGVDKQNEIDSLLAGALTEEDEAAANDELEKMLADDVATNLPDVPAEAIPERAPEKRPERSAIAIASEA